MTDETKSILMNKDAIAIDQDPLGKQAERLYQHGDYSVWTKLLADGRVAVGLFNTAGDARDVSVDLTQIGSQKSPTIHDVWENKDLGRHTGVYSRNVARHGVVLLIVSE